MENKHNVHQIPLQSNTNQIVNDFLLFYYDCLNKKDINSKDKNSFESLYKKYSEIRFNENIYKDESLYLFFNNLNSINSAFTVSTFDILMSGNHRVNILVNGSIKVYQNIFNFSEYIHFGTCKDNDLGYWIQSSILTIHDNKIRFPIKELSTTEPIVNQFLNFYCDCINQKNFISSNSKSLILLYKPYSEIKFNGVLYKGEKLSLLFDYFITNNSMLSITSADILEAGKYRVNILITGHIKILEKEHSFSEYIHFGICNDNQIGYMIQSSIFRILN